MNQQPLDLFSVVAALAGALLGQQMGPAVGAYLVIVLAWAGGVQVGLYRRDKTERMSTFSFVSITFILTIGVTAVLAEVLSARASVATTALLFPVAFLIPAVGDSWIRIAAWVVDKARARFFKEQ